MFEQLSIPTLTGLGYGAYILFRLDKKIYSSGRIVGILVFACYAFIGLNQKQKIW